jgi:hypothetical protein
MNKLIALFFLLLKFKIIYNTKCEDIGTTPSRNLRALDLTINDCKEGETDDGYLCFLNSEGSGC